MSAPSLPIDLPPQISLARQIQSVEREIKQRERVYPRWVSEGRMSQSFADEEIAAMKAIAGTLRGLQEGRV